MPAHLTATFCFYNNNQILFSVVTTPKRKCAVPLRELFVSYDVKDKIPLAEQILSRIKHSPRVRKSQSRKLTDSSPECA